MFFLYLFLPITVLVYYLTPGIRKQNMVLLVVSLLFYAMGQPLYVGLLFLMSYVNFAMARKIVPGKKGTLILPLAVNIGVLALFKYLDFFLGIIGISSQNGGVLLSLLKNMVTGLNAIGFQFKEPVTVLPLGISFYTFSVISYLADVYRKKVEPENSFRDLLLYLCLFPKMLQGPIARYEQVGKQVRERKMHPRMVFEGAVRFIIGLAKKVLLADYAGKVVGDLAVSQADGSLVGAWLSAIMFFFQLYFDFSGYSDMAIGLGQVFGFRFKENFDLPYTSTSITEFWRRWHISLSSFFRDYVYIPLGGNRKGAVRQVLNMLVVWLLTGLWHGAGWNFVLWGLYFFILLTVEKQMMPQLERIGKPLRNIITMFFVMVGWVLFSHTDMASLGRALGAMIGIGGFSSVGMGLRVLNSLPLLIVCIIGASPLPRYFGLLWSALWGMDKRERRKNTPVTGQKAVYLLTVFVFVSLLLWMCTVSLVGSTSAPSIYANF